MNQSKFTSVIPQILSNGLSHSMPWVQKGILHLHIRSLFLLPANTQLLIWEKSSVKTLKVWSDGAETIIQDCFECTDRHFQRRSYSGLSHRSWGSWCVDDVITEKQIRTLLNQKSWMNSSTEVCTLIQGWDAVFKAGKRNTLRVAIDILKSTIQSHTAGPQPFLGIKCFSCPQPTWVDAQGRQTHEKLLNLKESLAMHSELEYSSYPTGLYGYF